MTSIILHSIYILCVSTNEIKKKHENNVDQTIWNAYRKKEHMCVRLYVVCLFVTLLSSSPFRCGMRMRVKMNEWKLWAVCATVELWTKKIELQLYNNFLFPQSFTTWVFFTGFLYNKKTNTNYLMKKRHLTIERIYKTPLYRTFVCTRASNPHRASNLVPAILHVWMDLCMWSC